MANLYTENEIQDRLAGINGWSLDAGEITATYERNSFADALLFVSAVGQLAEAANHHPDIDIRYRNVTLRLSTHSAGGVTDEDFDLARRIAAIA